MPDGVKLHRDGHVLEVTLDRPKVNAIDVPTSQELAAAFVEFHEDPELRVAILTGGGERIFSAGWDLKALNAGEMQLDNWWETDNYGEGGFTGLTENWRLNKPVIAAINGLAIGGGFEMALGLRSFDCGRACRIRPARDAAGHRSGWGCLAAPAAAHSIQHRHGNVFSGTPDESR